MPPVMEVSGLFYRFFQGFWRKPYFVLNNIHLVIEKPSLCGLVGKNGAGKTTLIRLLIGLKKPFAGEIKIEGQNPCDSQTRFLIGYLPERPYCYDHLTGKQYLTHFAHLAHIEENKKKSSIQQALTQVHLLAEADKKLRFYSKGMLQRIHIARILLHDPKIFILDEPMSGLDAPGKRDMRDLFLHLHSQGKTILFTSHSMNDIDSLCHHIFLLHQGHCQRLRPGQQDPPPDSSRLLSFDLFGYGVLPETMIQDLRHKGHAFIPLPDNRFEIRIRHDTQEAVSHHIQLLLKESCHLVSIEPVPVSSDSPEGYFL